MATRRKTAKRTPPIAKRTPPAAKRTSPAEDRYLALFHRSPRAQTAEQWAAFVAALHRGRHLIGGSAVTKPRAIKAGRLIAARAATVGGYMIINATNAAEARALMKLSPTHLSGGQVDLFPFVRS